MLSQSNFKKSDEAGLTVSSAGRRHSGRRHSGGGRSRRRSRRRRRRAADRRRRHHRRLVAQTGGAVLPVVAALVVAEEGGVHVGRRLRQHVCPWVCVCASVSVWFFFRAYPRAVDEENNSNNSNNNNPTLSTRCTPTRVLLLLRSLYGPIGRQRKQHTTRRAPIIDEQRGQSECDN